MMKPTFMTRIAGFTVSMSEWLADGSPLRDPDETRELFETHCQGGDGPPCEAFLPKEEVGDIISQIAGKMIPENAGFCSECGCVVSDDPEAMVNKVNKPHQECPLKKWRKVVE